MVPVRYRTYVPVVPVPNVTYFKLTYSNYFFKKQSIEYLGRYRTAAVRYRYLPEPYFHMGYLPGYRYGTYQVPR